MSQPEGGTEKGFDVLLRELEGVVAKLERGNVPLQDAMALFEHGSALAKAAEAHLEGARAKVVALVEGQNGDIHERPFDIQ